MKENFHSLSFYKRKNQDLKTLFIRIFKRDLKMKKISMILTKENVLIPRKFLQKL
jgi:hypothetical protein